MRKRAKRKDLSQHGVHHVPLGIVAARLAAHPSSNSGSVAASRRARRRQRAASDISSTRGAAQPFVGGAPLMSARDATLAATHMCKVAVLFAQLAVEDACFVTERARGQSPRAVAEAIAQSLVDQAIAAALTAAGRAMEPLVLEVVDAVNVHQLRHRQSTTPRSRSATTTSCVRVFLRAVDGARGRDDARVVLSNTSAIVTAPCDSISSTATWHSFCEIDRSGVAGRAAEIVFEVIEVNHEIDGMDVDADVEDVDVEDDEMGSIHERSVSTASTGGGTASNHTPRGVLLGSGALPLASVLSGGVRSVTIASSVHALTWQNFGAEDEASCELNFLVAGRHRALSPTRAAMSPHRASVRQSSMLLTPPIPDAPWRNGGGAGGGGGGGDGSSSSSSSSSRLRGAHSDAAEKPASLLVDDADVRTVFLVRHGQSLWNLAKANKSVAAMMSQVDHPLSSAGIDECKSFNRAWRRERTVLRRRIRARYADEAARSGNGGGSGSSGPGSNAGSNAGAGAEATTPKRRRNSTTQADVVVAGDTSWLYGEKESDKDEEDDAAKHTKLQEFKLQAYAGAQGYVLPNSGGVSDRGKKKTIEEEIEQSLVDALTTEFLCPTAIYSSPLTRAVQTAMLVLQDHPSFAYARAQQAKDAVEGGGEDFEGFICPVCMAKLATQDEMVCHYESVHGAAEAGGGGRDEAEDYHAKVRLLRTARETKKSLGALDCVGKASGDAIVERACNCFAELIGTQEAIRVCDGIPVDPYDAVNKWWTVSVDSKKALENRMDEFLRTLQFGQPPGTSAIIVGHSSFFLKLYNRHTPKGGAMETLKPDLSEKLRNRKLKNAACVMLRMRFSHDARTRPEIVDARLMFDSELVKPKAPPPPPPMPSRTSRLARRISLIADGGSPSGLLPAKPAKPTRTRRVSIIDVMARLRGESAVSAQSLSKVMPGNSSNSNSGSGKLSAEEGSGGAAATVAVVAKAAYVQELERDCALLRKTNTTLAAQLTHVREQLIASGARQSELLPALAVYADASGGDGAAPALAPSSSAPPASSALSTRPGSTRGGSMYYDAEIISIRSEVAARSSSVKEKGNRPEALLGPPPLREDGSSSPLLPDEFADDAPPPEEDPPEEGPPPDPPGGWGPTPPFPTVPVRPRREQEEPKEAEAEERERLESDAPTTLNDVQRIVRKLTRLRSVNGIQRTLTITRDGLATSDPLGRRDTKWCVRLFVRVELLCCISPPPPPSRYLSLLCFSLLSSHHHTLTIPLR